MRCNFIWNPVYYSSALHKGDVDCTFCVHMHCGSFFTASLSRIENEYAVLPPLAASIIVDIIAFLKRLARSKRIGQEHMTMLKSLESGFISFDMYKQISTMGSLKK